MGSMNEEVREPSSTYKTQSEDTSYVAERLLFELWGKMSDEEKLNRIFDLNRSCRELAEMGIRERYPDASDEEIRLRLASLHLDRETMIQVYNWDPQKKGY